MIALRDALLHPAVAPLALMVWLAGAFMAGYVVGLMRARQEQRHQDTLQMHNDIRRVIDQPPRPSAPGDRRQRGEDPLPREPAAGGPAETA